MPLPLTGTVTAGTTAALLAMFRLADLAPSVIGLMNFSSTLQLLPGAIVGVSPPQLAPSWRESWKSPLSVPLMVMEETPSGALPPFASMRSFDR